MKLRALYVAESITSRHLTGLHAVFAESGITNRVVLMMRQFVTTVLRDTSNLQCI